MVNGGPSASIMIPSAGGVSVGSANPRAAIGIPVDSNQPSFFVPADDFNTTPMNGVAESLAVQEFAFRQGQLDRGNPEGRVPPCPYLPNFTWVWETFYNCGKNAGTTPSIHATVPGDEANSGQTWAPLINPYTQDLEYPNGSTDHHWTRQSCERAMRGMDLTVAAVHRRQGDWANMVIDVPKPIADALRDFPDLLMEYERIKEEGADAQDRSRAIVMGGERARRGEV